MKEKNKITDRVRISIVLEAIRDIESFMHSISQENFLSNRWVQSACAKKLQDLCNASEDLSDEIKIKNPDIPWFQMDGIRNRIAHEYFGINYKIIWTVIQKDLPEIKIIFEKILLTLEGWFESIYIDLNKLNQFYEPI